MVDDGNLPSPPLQHEFENAGVAYKYLKKEKPGLTESRNAGIAASSGEIIFFFDDDVDILPDYLAKILDIYEGDMDQSIAGVGGNVVNTKPMTFWRTVRWMIGVVFLNTGFCEGKILPSGFCTNFGCTPFGLKKTREVDFLCGCACSFRRQIFSEMLFTDGYHSVAIGEDKDFMGRLSRTRRLIFTPDSRLKHFEAPVMRPRKRDLGRQLLLGRYYLLRDVMSPSWLHWLCFYYASAGYLLMRMVIALIRFDRKEYEHALGVIDALGLVIRGKVLDPDGCVH